MVALAQLVEPDVVILRRRVQRNGNVDEPERDRALMRYSHLNTPRFYEVVFPRGARDIRAGSFARSAGFSPL